MEAEVKDIHSRCLHAECSEGSADLAAMIGPVVQGPSEPDTQWGVSLVPVSRVHLSHDGIGVEVTCKEPRPPVAPSPPQVTQAHPLVVDERLPG
jgi:hypothetical protein